MFLAGSDVLTDLNDLTVLNDWNSPSWASR
jgi:hypothetical protein